MKKSLLFTLSLMMVMGVMAQETIVGWTFPTGVDTVDVDANLGLEVNSGKYISAEDTTAWPDTQMAEVTMSNGAGEDGDFAASASGWDDGANAKVWSIKFKAIGYSNLKISSKQRSGGNKPGPRDWKLQARLKNEEWVDIPNGEVTVANDWTTGVVNELALPAVFDNSESSMYIRWIMTSNMSSNGTDDVLATGTSKIDDVILIGTSATGVEEEIGFPTVSLFPNPAKNLITVNSVNQINLITIQNALGSTVDQVFVNTNNAKVDISHLNQGIYFVSTFEEGKTQPIVSKLIVE